MQVPLAELLDRFAIVRLKVEHGLPQNGEFGALASAIAKSRVSLRLDERSIQSRMATLYKIHGSIWALEADIRRGREGELGMEEVGRRAIAIRDLNRERIAIKNDICAATGEGFRETKIDHASCES